MSTDRTPSGRPEICVVGSGLAGALVADSLAERGRDVVVLEAGPSFDRQAKLDRMRRQIRPGTTAGEVWGMGGPRDAYTTGGGSGWPLNQRRVKGVGGTTLNWLGVAARFPPGEFDRATHTDHGRDWPIGYDELRPYYADAERRLGVAGEDTPVQPPREREYPRAPRPPSRSDELFARAGDAVGVPVHPLPVAEGTEGGPAARPDEGEPTVRPPEAIYSADTHVHSAVDSGARLIDRAPVERLDHGPDGERVTAAVYRTPDGRRHRQTAETFVVACGTVETARLLLLSSSPQYPAGLANSSGTVGRYLMGQPSAGVVGVVDEPTEQRQRGGLTAGSYRFADPAEETPGFALTCYNNAGETPAELALEADCWGDRLLEEVSFHHGETLGLGVRVPARPRAENRVTLDESVTDDAGDAVPAVHFEPGDRAARAQRRGIDLAEALIEELGGAVRHADGSAVGESVPPSAAGGHYAVGGTRMGTDPTDSVVDPTGRSHDLDNLYVAGGSVFVTSGTVPPALTIAALALRTADRL